MPASKQCPLTLSVSLKVWRDTGLDPLAALITDMRSHVHCKVVHTVKWYSASGTMVKGYPIMREDLCLFVSPKKMFTGKLKLIYSELILSAEKHACNLKF